MPKSLFLNDLEQAIWLVEAMFEAGLSYEKAIEIIKRFNEKRNPKGSGRLDEYGNWVGA